MLYMRVVAWQARWVTAYTAHFTTGGNSETSGEPGELEGYAGSPKGGSPACAGLGSRLGLNP
jgi:hypothetical protein